MSSALFAVTRRRLVLWNIAVTGVIIAAIALVAYVIASHVLTGEIDNQLALRAGDVRAHLSHDLAVGFNDDHDYDTGATGIFLLALSPDGTILYNSLNEQFAGLPDMQAVRAVLVRGHPDLRTVNIGANGSIEVRLRTEVVKNDNGNVVGVMQLGASTQPYEHELHLLLLVLAAVSAGGLVLALFGGFFLASRALVPVRSAFQRQRDFVADASHELRTPLMLIRADIDVLGRELRAIRARLPLAKTTARADGESAPAGGLALAEPDEAPGVVDAGQLDDQLELVGDALGEIDRMTRLLRDMLLLARLDANAVKATHQPVALTDQLEGLVEQVRRRAELQGLAIDVHLERGLWVVGNTDQLRQLWLILLDNAIRYNRPAGRITLTGAAEHHQVWVSVADTGIGIAHADLPRLFERFYRADKAHARFPTQGTDRPGTYPEGQGTDVADLAGSGAGLGLAIAQEIVQAHAGQISVKSTPGEGTIFTVRLPLGPLN
jgi:signal transduction histidine kinase